MEICKNVSSPENREFWESVFKTAEEVRKWPTWMQGESERIKRAEQRRLINNSTRCLYCGRDN
jgi:hypothetical protein